MAPKLSTVVSTPELIEQTTVYLRRRKSHAEGLSVTMPQELD